MQIVISRRHFLKLAAATVGSLYASWPALSSTTPMLESRAILDEGVHWFTKDSAEVLLDRIKRAGFNVFMPCVWHGRGTRWPSKLAPWDLTTKNIPGFDPLENLILRAQQYEIEIHPWFTVMLRQREFFSQFYDNRTPSHSFDVHREEFRQFISSLIGDVVSRYPIQGINLDFIRAGGVCASPSCVKKYKSRTGRDLLADSRLRKVPGANLKDLIAWQEEAVRDIVLRVSQQARKVNKDIVISVDAAPGNPIVELEGQNSMKWADEGLIDVIYSMDYQLNPDYEKLRNLQSKMKRPEALVMLCGNYDKIGPQKKAVPREARKVTENLAQARSIGSGGNGVGLYLYSMLDDEQINLLSKTVFRSPGKPRWLRATATHL